MIELGSRRAPRSHVHCADVQSVRSSAKALPGKFGLDRARLFVSLTNSGCQAYIVREGWEGLVRGNTEDPTPAASARPSAAASPAFGAVPPPPHLITPESFNLDSSKSDADGGDEAHGVNYADPTSIADLTASPLRFGYGGLLRDGAGEFDEDEFQGAVNDPNTTGKTLRGKYIVRVGWDDVRGWLGDGGTVIGSSRCPSCKCAPFAGG